MRKQKYVFAQYQQTYYSPFMSFDISSPLTFSVLLTLHWGSTWQEKQKVGGSRIMNAATHHIVVVEVVAVVVEGVEDGL